MKLCGGVELASMIPGGQEVGTGISENPQPLP